MIELLLYSREGCHLCDDMLHALRPLQTQMGFTITLIDIDADQVLHEQYNELVPVLVGPEGEICRYRLDVDALSRHFASPPA